MGSLQLETMFRRSVESIKIKKIFNHSKKRRLHKFIYCRTFVFEKGINDYIYAKMLINGFVTYVMQLKLEQIS